MTLTPTANSLARRFFSDLPLSQTSVSNTALHQFIAERLHQTHAVLNGTLDGTGPGSLIGSDWYTGFWHKKKLTSGRVVHCRNKSGMDITAQREMDFDFPAKRETCQRIMRNLPATGCPQLLTLASAHGNCVQAAIQRNPNVRIDNVESRDDVLQVWKSRKISLGVETTDHRCTLQEFTNATVFAARHFDLINADAMGYAGRTMFEYLWPINRAKNTNILAVTTQKLDAFRNHGDFQDGLRKRYAKSKDPHAACIVDWLPNYEMIDRFVYRKDDQSKHREVFVFKLEA